MTAALVILAAFFGYYGYRAWRHVAESPGIADCWDDVLRGIVCLAFSILYLYGALK